METLKAKFFISKYGFLMENPEEDLPEYFEPWNTAAKQMPDLVEQKRMRHIVNTMELLDHTYLNTHKEFMLAHLQLTIIASGYVWQDGDEGVVYVLPECIAVPLCAVSDKLGIKPVISYSTFILSNWGWSNTKSMQCLYRVPGGDEAAWFVEVSCQIERDFAPAVQHIVKALERTKEGDNQCLVEQLVILKSILQKMKNTFTTMHEKLTARTFYSATRPFLAGWGGEKSPLPDGLIYDGVSSTPEKAKKKYIMIGGSAAQSPTLQCMDAFLGVVHAPEKAIYLKEMRNYMLPAHRAFVTWIENTSNIREYVQNQNNDVLSSAYNACIKSVVDFRSYHIQIVTKYIILMANNSKTNDSNASTTSSKHGTGGTALLPFLKNIRCSTSKCSVQTKEKNEKPTENGLVKVDTSSETGNT